MPIIKKSQIEELVDSDGGAISGDRNATNDSEIETGPIAKPFNDTSDYEKGVSTTTDRASRYRQNIPWFAVYSVRNQGGRGQTMAEGKGLEEDLVKKSSRDRDIFDSKFDNKVEKLIDAIEDNDLTPEQLEKIKQSILKKLK